jgi:hypothetical protein
MSDSEPESALRGAETGELGADSVSAPRLSIVGVVRIVMGAVGLGGFVLGAMVAWHSASASTLLIASAVLLVLAALGLDWNKIRGTYRGLQVELLRGVEAQIEQAKSLVASAAIEDESTSSSPALREVVQSLESLGEQVKALTPPRPARRQHTTATFPPAGLDELFREAMKTKATHLFQRGGESVQLQLRIVPLGSDARYRCTVRTPTGGVYSAVTRRHINVGVNIVGGANNYTVTYPDDFAGSEPMTPGKYDVEWRTAPLEDPVATTALVSAIMQLSAAPVATDSFTIPDHSRAAPATAAQGG